jgi:hypothetical protein
VGAVRIVDQGDKLSCHVASNSVTVSIKDNVMHNHAYGWNMPEARRSDVVRRRGGRTRQLEPHSERGQVRPVDPSATIQRYACTWWGDAGSPTSASTEKRAIAVKRVAGRGGCHLGAARFRSLPLALADVFSFFPVGLLLASSSGIA